MKIWYSRGRRRSRPTGRVQPMLLCFGPAEGDGSHLRLPVRRFDSADVSSTTGRLIGYVSIKGDRAEFQEIARRRWAAPLAAGTLVGALLTASLVARWRRQH